MRILSKVIQPFVDFVFPPVCLSCANKLINDEQFTCKPCWQSIRRPASVGELERELMSAFSVERHISRASACFYFEGGGALQSLIHVLKYDGRRSVGLMLGRYVGEFIASDGDFCSADILVPVPLHRAKRRGRGYNQSDYICRGIAEVTGIPFRTDLLKRKKDTLSQTQLTREERKQNVAGAFVVSQRCPGLIKGRTVILVDDVITTGATMDECAKELLKNGAGSVYAVAVAAAM